MKRSKCSEEQIVSAIRQAEADTPVGDLCRQLRVSDATFYAWKKQYVHLGVSKLRRLRQLEEENSRLTRLVADLSLEKTHAGAIDNGGKIFAVGRSQVGSNPVELWWVTAFYRGNISCPQVLW